MYLPRILTIKDLIQDAVFHKDGALHLSCIPKGTELK